MAYFLCFFKVTDSEDSEDEIPLSELQNKVEEISSSQSQEKAKKPSASQPDIAEPDSNDNEPSAVNGE